MGRRGQSFVEFCVICGALILAILAMSPIISVRVQEVIHAFLNFF